MSKVKTGGPAAVTPDTINVPNMGTAKGGVR